MSPRDLAAARALALAGVPLFMAEPDPTQRTGFRLPVQWERGARADPTLVDALPEGWALCAVMGHGLDLVDIDPRNGGDRPTEFALPPAVATARTPSGGTHLFVLSLGLPSLDGVAPGVDYKGGTPGGQGRGFAFIAPTVRLSKVDGRPRSYQWTDPPRGGTIEEGMRVGATIGYDQLRAAILARRQARAAGEARTVPASVARREWSAALDRLADDLLRWAASGWGGEAHHGLLQHTTHLARLWPDGAEEGFRSAFARVGLSPDGDDLAKLDSALRTSVPDVVVPDGALDPQEAFWLGAEVSPGPPAQGPPADPAAGAEPGGPFDFVDPDELEAPRPLPAARWGAFGGPAALFYDAGVHWLQGESESGKSWVALGVALEVLRAGGAVLLLDYEDTRAEVLSRLRALGAARDDAARLVYLDGYAVGHADVAAHLAATDRDYALLVVDGVTSALDAAQLSGRDEQELTRWANAVPRRARAAVCVDHVVKAPDERNGMAIGSQAKKSVVTGTALEVRCRDKFGLGRSGRLELRLQKDKRGGVRALGRMNFGVRVECGADGSVRLVAAGAARTEPSDAGAFLGADLPAEQEARAAELCRVLQESGVSPALTANALVRRLREDLNQGAKKTTMLRAVHLFKGAAGQPVDLSRPPIGEVDDE